MERKILSHLEWEDHSIPYFREGRYVSIGAKSQVPAQQSGSKRMSHRGKLS